MRAYWIFAVCLTVVYIIYYAVNIVRDLYGKKDEKPSGEEFFEVDSVDEQEESGVRVCESERGFSIGSETFETNIVCEERSDDRETDAEREKRAQAEFERKKSQMESEMETARPCLSDAYDQEALRMALVNKGISKTILNLLDRKNTIWLRMPRLQMVLIALYNAIATASTNTMYTIHTKCDVPQYIPNQVRAFEVASWVSTYCPTHRDKARQ